MEVEYELAPADLLAFQRYHQQNPLQPPSNKSANVLVAVIMGIAGVTTALFFLLSDNATAAWYLIQVPFVGIGAGLALLGIIVYALLTAGRLQLGVLKQGRNAAKVFGRRRVVMDAEAIRSTSEYASSAYFWHGIDRFGATRDHAFIYINTTTAVIVPRAAFRDDEEFKEFVDAARRYRRLNDRAREAPRGGWFLDRRGDTVDEGIVRGQGDPAQRSLRQP